MAGDGRDKQQWERGRALLRRLPTTRERGRLGLAAAALGLLLTGIALVARRQRRARPARVLSPSSSSAPTAGLAGSPEGQAATPAAVEPDTPAALSEPAAPEPLSASSATAHSLVADVVTAPAADAAPAGASAPAVVAPDTGTTGAGPAPEAPAGTRGTGRASRAVPRRIAARPAQPPRARRSAQRTTLAAGLLTMCAAAAVLVSGLSPLDLGPSGVRGSDTPVAQVVATVVEEPPGPDCTVLKCVALTFDDGPDRYSTTALLDILEARGVPANFFVLGYLIHGNEDILLRMERLGMGVENHTWDHPNLTALSPAGVMDQLNRTDAEIERVLGASPRYMRPPYGAWTPGYTPTGGMRPVMWEVDPQDWLYRNSAVVARNVVNVVRPGDVILLHDIHQTSVDAVPTIIDSLHSRGFTFVTLDDLYAARPDCPIEQYCAPTATTTSPSATTTVAPVAASPSPARPQG